MATALLNDTQLASLGLSFTSQVSQVPGTAVAVLQDWLPCAFIAAASTLYTAGMVSSIYKISRTTSPAWSVWAEEKLNPLGLAYRYGLFARMTTSRDEVVIKELHELPDDMVKGAIEDGLAQPAEPGKFWVELALPYKPGPLNRAPPALLNHMPRLDWHMWFVSLNWARLGERPPWFDRFLKALLQREPEIIRLVEHGGQHPVQSYVLRQRPEEIRVTLEDYQYNDPILDAKAAPDQECGDWWCRRNLHPECQISLKQ